MEILNYIGAHWIEWLFAACLAGLTLAWRAVIARLKQEQAKNEAIAEGMQALLRDSIVGTYNKQLNKGYCPIYVKESIKKIYAAYTRLGGNDVATDLYKKLLDMPTEQKEGE